MYIVLCGSDSRSGDVIRVISASKTCSVLNPHSIYQVLRARKDLILISDSAVSISITLFKIQTPSLWDYDIKLWTLGPSQTCGENENKFKYKCFWTCVVIFFITAERFNMSVFISPVFSQHVKNVLVCFSNTKITQEPEGSKLGSLAVSWSNITFF